VSRMVTELVRRVHEAVQASALRMNGSMRELRIVFHGPPSIFLEPLFEQLSSEGGLEVSTNNGETIRFPILLQVDRLPPNEGNPDIGRSGRCDEAHLLALRNSPDCPRFLALVAPGRHQNLSVSSASTGIGLSAENNSGNATIEDWWGDDFIQELVEAALARAQWEGSGQRDQARRMIERAVRAADEVDKHDSSRQRPWSVLSRIFSISDAATPFCTQLAAACGFPPLADGSIHISEQQHILETVAALMVDDGFRTTLDDLKEEATLEDITALDGCLAHLQMVCDVSTALGRSAPFFYAPSQTPEYADPPSWWRHLTVERWAELLEEEKRPSGALVIECTNSIVPHARGVNALVKDVVVLRIALPPNTAPTKVRVVRQSGGASGRREWELNVENDATLTDDGLPMHRTAIRYSAEAVDYKTATVKVVSLGSWEPGAFVFCRTARKTILPKKSKPNKESIALEASLDLVGRGRHYVDIYVRPGVALGDVASRSDDTLDEAVGSEAAISLVSECVYGVELDASTECSYDLTIRIGADNDRKLRLFLTADETQAEGCRTEFERLIRLNRQLDRGRGQSDVQIDRQARCADLQTWMLDRQAAEHSYYPVVLASDYSDNWRPPQWRRPEGTILSSGRFIHDPRPAAEDFRPPAEFITSRAALFELIRGADGSGLIEATQLGVLLAAKPDFAILVEQYITAYSAWLEADPDVAIWCDVCLVAPLEADGKTLGQEPDAVLVSPLHPARLAWQAMAQRALYVAYQRNSPCPAASILDPDIVPDVLILPLRAADGTVKRQPFFAAECSSDYWSVLWNASRLDVLSQRGSTPPLDREFGVELGGVSSGFSVSQVQRALDDVAAMLSAKPVINVVLASSSGRNSACNEGVVTWALREFGLSAERTESAGALGARVLQVFDERRADARPDESAISNVAEDTGNAVRWYARMPDDSKPDLGIVAQLETSAPSASASEFASPVGIGGLLRHRIRRQLKAGSGAFLSESRTGLARPSSGDALADKTLGAIVRLENAGESRYGYTFAPSVHAIKDLLIDRRADFAAVSSSAVDPACFLGGWLEESYLWDYDLPSYSHRAGDTNGYYLLSQVKEVDKECLRSVLGRLPACGDMSDDVIHDVILEVARRGIPTIRGLSGGDSGAAGDLGLFLAGRLLQDEFRPSGATTSLMPILIGEKDALTLGLIIPVDPFAGYLDDLQRACGAVSAQRPDLLVAAIDVAGSSVRCRLTAIEVKFRSGVVMTSAACKEALQQAQAFGALLQSIHQRARDPDMLIWRLALQHLLLAMLGFSFRVYSQQRLATQQSSDWALIHQKVAHAILSDEIELEIDTRGRLVIFDSSAASAPRDVDQDGFFESIIMSPRDAGTIAGGAAEALYTTIIDAVGNWDLLPSTRAPQKPDIPSVDIEAGRVASGYPELVPPATPKVADGGSDSQRGEGNQAADSRDNAATVSGVFLRIGSTVGGFRSEPRVLNLSDTNLNQLNIGVVGDLGTGKTQLLKSLVYQISASASVNSGVRPRVLIFDYKKDYGSDEFIQATGAKVVKPYRLPLNLFDVSDSQDSPAPWLDRFKFFSDVLDKIFSGIGPVQRSQLKQAVKAAYEDATSIGKQPTIYDVHARYQAALNGRSDAPLSIIDDLVDMELFSREPPARGGFGEFFDGVVVVALAHLGQDDRTKNMLVAIMLNLFYEHMLKIPKRPYTGTDPQLRTVDSFLLVDEADNIMRYEFDVLRKVLLQGREFGVGVILASQYLRHFKAGGTDYREPLLTWFIHKVPNVAPQELAALGFTADLSDLAERVKSLPKHECLYKSSAVAGEVLTGLPFFRLWEDRARAPTGAG
jgi:DNA phosphorothioation-dependent restriction protein DptH